MKIAEILEIASKRTRGEWKFNELNTVESINYGDFIKREEYQDLDDKTYKMWLMLNYTASICNCTMGFNDKDRPYRNDGRFIAIAPEMESKLRLLSELLPEIKIAIQDAYSYRSNAVSKKGKKWAAEYENLLTRLEVLENE